MMQFISTLDKELQDRTITVKLTKVPSYISCFIPLDEIILIHKKESKKYNCKGVSDENDAETSHLSDEDVSGHPLETQLSTGNVTVFITDPFEHYEHFEEKGHLPLTLNKARECLNLCNLKFSSPYPNWIVTDGNDLQKTILLSSFKSNGWIRRSWARDKGAMSEMPTLQSLKQIHGRLTSIQDPLISCQVRSTYIIQSVPNEHNLQEYYSCTMLQASWNTFKVNPPLDKSTEVTLVTKCKIGKGSGGLFFLWKQLQLIHEYVEIIIERSRNNCTDTNIMLPSCLSYLQALKKTPCEESPLERIGKVLKEPMRGCSSLSNKTSLTEIINMLISTGRPGMDITDKLWYLFIECSSYPELCACFKQLFIELKKVGTNTPFISSSNISSLANCLLGHGGASILDPLEYLVEVGLDKLKKEILFIFSKAQIATLNNLNMPKLPKFSEVSTSDWMPTVQKWLLWFSQVHCALEILWNTQEAIFLSNDSLLTFTSTVLNVFTGPNSKIQSFERLLENNIQEIRTNVPMSVVERRLESNPEQWVLTLNTELEGRKVQSVFYRGLQSPFSHIVRDPELSNTLTNMSLNEESNYYWAELYSVSDEI